MSAIENAMRIPPETDSPTQTPELQLDAAELCCLLKSCYRTGTSSECFGDFCTMIAFLLLVLAN